MAAAVPAPVKKPEPEPVDEEPQEDTIPLPPLPTVVTPVEEPLQKPAALPAAFPAAAPVAKKPEGVVDVNSLPRLTPSDRSRLGLSEFRLNVLREASATQPEALAIINLKKVYVGEMVPGTKARLIAVQSRAIAIEMDDTGERFKVTN